MTAHLAQIPISLTEVLQPSDLAKLLNVSAAGGRQPGETIVLAIRQYLDREGDCGPGPAAPGLMKALPAGASGSASTQPEGLAA